MTILLYVLVIVFIIAFPAETADTAWQALMIWSTGIVPFLFPYMVFSRLLCTSLHAFRLPAFPVIAVLGMLGGSPNGAALITANAQFLSERSLFTLCALTGTISPMFILGSVQKWIAPSSISGYLLFCHWLSAVLCAWTVWLVYRGRQEAIPLKPEENKTKSADPLTQSIDAIFHIGGYIIVYSVLAGMLGKILHAFPAVLPLSHAIFEISGGVHAISQSLFSDQAKHILISAALGFSGFSILSQNHTMLRPPGIPMRKLFLFAVLRAAISALIMACMTAWLPIS